MAYGLKASSCDPLTTINVNSGIFSYGATIYTKLFKVFYFFILFIYLFIYLFFFHKGLFFKTIKQFGVLFIVNQTAKLGIFLTVNNLKTCSALFRGRGYYYRSLFLGFARQAN